MQILIRKAILMAGLLLPLYTSAAETFQDPSSKTTFPLQVEFSADGKNYVLDATGAATRSKFFVKVYSVAHYTEKLSGKNPEALITEIFRSNAPKQLTTIWLHNVEAKKIQDAYVESFHKTATPQQYAASQKEIDQFIGIFNQDVKVNDQQILRWLPGGTIEVYVKGEKRGSITNKDFAPLVWNLWFSPKAAVNRVNLVSLVAKE